jgi:hypothetical protein
MDARRHEDLERVFDEGFSCERQETFGSLVCQWGKEGRSKVVGQNDGLKYLFGFLHI